MSSSIRLRRWRGIHTISTSCIRPSLSITGISPSTATSDWVSGVADMARIRRSGRRVAATSSVSANPMSVGRFRSCTSSKITRPTPGNSGSPCSRRVRMPSVTTSIRVSGPMWRSSRVWYPTVPPTCSPSRLAIRRAAARVASRRGSSITIRRSSEPCLIEQCEWHEGGLAGTRWSHQHRPPLCGECGSSSASKVSATGRSGSGGRAGDGTLSRRLANRRTARDRREPAPLARSSPWWRRSPRRPLAIRRSPSPRCWRALRRRHV